MREFEHKRKVRKILSSPLVLLSLTVILIFLVRGTWSIYLKDRASAEELRLARERLLRMQDRHDKVSGAVEELKTEKGIEGEIRDRFVMARKGEREIIIVDEQGKTDPALLAPTGFLQKIWDFFTIR